VALRIVLDSALAPEYYKNLTVVTFGMPVIGRGLDKVVQSHNLHDMFHFVVKKVRHFCGNVALILCKKWDFVPGITLQPKDILEKVSSYHNPIAWVINYIATFKFVDNMINYEPFGKYYGLHEGQMHKIEKEKVVDYIKLDVTDIDENVFDKHSMTYYSVSINSAQFDSHQDS
jgi:hypothetical protein